MTRTNESGKVTVVVEVGDRVHVKGTSDFGGRIFKILPGGWLRIEGDDGRVDEVHVKQVKLCRS